MKPTQHTAKHAEGHTPTPWEVGGEDRAGCSTVIAHLTPGASYEVASHLVRRDAAFIVHAVNSHEALLEACKLAFQNLKPKGDVKKDYSGHLTMAALSKAISQAEGKV